VQGVIGVSDDGSYVYFVATGQLVHGQPLGTGAAIPSVYLWHGGAVTYVGQLQTEDLPADLITDNTHDDLEARVTPDGRHLLFGSSASEGLTGADPGHCGIGSFGPLSCRELYLYSADTVRLACVSCRPDGAPAESGAKVVHGGRIEGTPLSTGHLTRPLSEDGRRVFFDTGDALVSQDINGRRDVYEYDASDGTVHLLTSGRGAADSLFMDATPDGSEVFLLTTERLVGWDNDASADLYDVRAGGGFPEPRSSSSGCADEGCRGQAAAPLVFGAPASAAFSGAGNFVLQPSRAVVRKKARRKPKRHKARKHGKKTGKATTKGKGNRR
jgi:hypothetical protein